MKQPTPWPTAAGFQPPRLRDDGPIYARRTHEIFRLEHNELLYRMYPYPEGKVMFRVTCDNIRLCLLTKEHLHWDCSFQNLFLQRILK